MASLPYPRSPFNNSPTDGTDAHRWLGCVGFSHGIHRSFWRRRASHRFHRCPQMVRLRRLLPRNSRNSQKLLAEKSLPRMRTDAHRWLGCVGFSHGIHGIHRSFCGRLFSARNFCGFCGFCGKIFLWLRGYGRDAIPSYSLHCLLCWCT